MNALLGVEVPNTTGMNQTSIPYGFIDPATELLRSSVTGAPIGSLADGAQIWKITHNGVDTHAIHVHLFNMQLVNRVGWDGMVKPPDANELGWKETIRMNPLEDVIVAFTPTSQTLPTAWGGLPNSFRTLDVTMPQDSALPMFAGVDPSNQPAPVTNQRVNFGWEYMWRCHLLGHEENDMIRPMILAIPSQAPITLTATRTGTTTSQRIVLTKSYFGPRPLDQHCYHTKYYRKYPRHHYNLHQHRACQSDNLLLQSSSQQCGGIYSNICGAGHWLSQYVGRFHAVKYCQRLY